MILTNILARFDYMNRVLVSFIVVLTVAGLLIGRYIPGEYLGYISTVVSLGYTLLSIYNFIQSYNSSQKAHFSNLELQIQSKLDNILTIFVNKPELHLLYDQIYRRMSIDTPITMTSATHQVILMIIHTTIYILSHWNDIPSQFQAHYQSIIKRWFRSPLVQQVWQEEKKLYDPSLDVLLSKLVPDKTS